ncbi:hypothetical protein DSO57_1014577 [Entomophthora muscae]|uniref:Uncharacterized protein n=1 Tax=Entomophthora muscae TaxID=34485 RepID=A0ACC2TGD3_9FUNG|nr:hypothetical protein DSO57_1014577 [Entomophthora muscae]
MSYSLQQKLADSNIGVYAVHPGIVRTELYRQQGWLNALTYYGGKYAMKSPLEGALTVIRMALIPSEEIQYDANSPVYYTDDLPMDPLVWSKDEAKQSALWNETSKLVGLDASLEN